jgi:hypothetical protein
MSIVVFDVLIGMSLLVIWKLPTLAHSVDEYQQTVAALRQVLDLSRLPVESGEVDRSLDISNIQGDVCLMG